VYEEELPEALSVMKGTSGGEKLAIAVEVWACFKYNLLSRID
jgi:hypothetical protein